MNAFFMTPEELFETPDGFAFSQVIDSGKEQVMKQILKNFGNELYHRLVEDAKEDSKKLCEQYYCAEVRGCTLKVNTDCFGKQTIEFDDIYLGPRAISPIMPNSISEDDNRIIVSWLDKCFRVYLSTVYGWHTGIIKDNDSKEKIVVYAIRKIEY